jgi:methylenetetrahydrofolate dehydrogenase (NADP+) / methenyltetrahydrofolate cyclohydrolase
MAQLIDGKQTAQWLRDQVKENTAKLIAKYGVTPHLSVILVGDNAASESYVRGKEIACQKAGIQSTVVRKPATTTAEELTNIIDELNADPKVHGILLQLPIPKHLDADFFVNRIRSAKDVDGFTMENVAKLTVGKPHLVPCTPLGVMRLLERYQISIQGKNAVVIGRSQIVGKPMASLLLKENATVTICHSKTRDLRAVCQTADILVAAIGVPKMIDASYVKPGAVVIDVGISKVDGVIQGDVDFASVEQIAAYITPVPGGVGPMTIACLLENTLKCYEGLMGE